MSIVQAHCPQCGSKLDHNDVGAWCPNYPCRYAIKRTRVAIAAAVAQLVWGDEWADVQSHRTAVDE